MSNPLNDPQVASITCIYLLIGMGACISGFNEYRGNAWIWGTRTLYFGLGILAHWVCSDLPRAWQYSPFWLAPIIIVLTIQLIAERERVGHWILELLKKLRPMPAKQTAE